MTPENLQAIIGGSQAPYVSTNVSPSGRFVLVTVANEMRMSHWIEHGSLYRVEDAILLADLGDSMWSVDSAQWHDDTRLTLSLSRYPGSPVGVKIDINLQDMLCTFLGEQKTLPLGKICDELDRLARQPARTPR